MRLIDDFLKKCRKNAAQNSHTCDACGAEVFSYPNPRICPACQTALVYNNEYQCDKCGRPTPMQGVCNTCKSHVPTFEKGASVFAYYDKAASVVNGFKNGKRWLRYWFAEELKSVLPRLSQKEYVLVTVPITKEKRRARGYNQSEELVEEFARLTGLSFRVDLLERKKTDEQKHQSGGDRRKNIQGAFRVTDRKFCKGKDILVVDDILTSGATLSEISSVLLRSGANSVCVLTVAAVPDCL